MIMSKVVLIQKKSVTRASLILIKKPAFTLQLQANLQEQMHSFSPNPSTIFLIIPNKP